MDPSGFDERRGEGVCGGPRCLGGAIGASGEAFLSKLLIGASGYVSFTGSVRHLSLLSFLLVLSDVIIIFGLLITQVRTRGAT